jgi:Tfp pilus assembly protein PilV
LFKSIISAYSGTYVVEGDTVIHDVNLSWNEAWTGTRQMRLFKVTGDELVIETTPRTAGTDARQFINTLTWERTEAFPAGAGLQHERQTPCHRFHRFTQIKTQPVVEVNLR